MRTKAETKGNEGSEGFPQSGRIGIYLCFLRYLLLKKVPEDRPAVMPYVSLLSGKSVAKFTSVLGEEVARIYGYFSLQSSWKRGSARNGSQIGSSRSNAGVIAKSYGVWSRRFNRSMA